MKHITLNRVKVNDLDDYLSHVNETLVITKFTSKSKMNATYNEIHTNMTRSLDIAKKQLNEIFLDKFKNMSPADASTL